MKEKFNLSLAFKEITSDFYPGNILKSIYRYFLVVLGSFILAAGVGLFLIPFNIVSGGVSGLGIIIGTLLHADTNEVITILQWSLFVLGYFLLGAKFTLKTLFSTILYPVFLFVFSYILSQNPMFDLHNTGFDNGTNVLIAGIAGGALVGLGVGLTFSGGGSTGGVDCINIFASKHLHIKPSLVTFIVDSSIIIANFIIAQDFVVLIIGVASAYISARLIDKTFISDRSYLAFIISDKWKEINKVINEELPRGTTLFDCHGGYTSENKVMIQVAFNNEEYEALQKLVYRQDRSAFMSITKATEVNGSGFRKVSKRLKREINFEDKIKGKKTKFAKVQQIDNVEQKKCDNKEDTKDTKKENK